MNNTIIITDDHLKLIRNMYVDWDDSHHGAPVINSKRPYGSNLVTWDVHEILTGERPPTVRIGNELERKYLNLHNETGLVLEVVLHTGKFETGTYRQVGTSNQWEKVV